MSVAPRKSGARVRCPNCDAFVVVDPATIDSPTEHPAPPPPTSTIRDDAGLPTPATREPVRAPSSQSPLPSLPKPEAVEPALSPTSRQNNTARTAVRTPRANPAAARGGAPATPMLDAPAAPLAELPTPPVNLANRRPSFDDPGRVAPWYRRTIDVGAVPFAGICAAISVATASAGIAYVMNGALAPAIIIVVVTAWAGVVTLAGVLLAAGLCILADLHRAARECHEQPPG